MTWIKYLSQFHGILSSPREIFILLSIFAKTSSFACRMSSFTCCQFSVLNSAQAGLRFPM